MNSLKKPQPIRFWNSSVSLKRLRRKTMESLISMVTFQELSVVVVEAHPTDNFISSTEDHVTLQRLLVWWMKFIICLTDISILLFSWMFQWIPVGIFLKISFCVKNNHGRKLVYKPRGPKRTSAVWKFVMQRTLDIYEWIKVWLIAKSPKYFVVTFLLVFQALWKFFFFEMSD